MKIKTIIEQLEAHIVSECTRVDVESAYDEMLDKCYSFESVGGIFAHMSPSTVLKECDPIAYRCGKNDWLDGEGYIEIAGGYYNANDVKRAKEDFVSSMDQKIVTAKSELEGAEDENDLDEVCKQETLIASLRASLATIEKHSF